MAQSLFPLAAFIFSAAVFGSVLGKAPSPTLMSVPGLAPTVMSVPGLAPTPTTISGLVPTPMSVPGLEPTPMFIPSPESCFGPAPAPGLDCLNILFNMSDCLSFVTPGSNLTKPDQLCCPELAGLVESNPICLCQLLGDPESLGIDVTRALKLPSACAISTPPVSLCSVLGIPVAAPMASEGPSAPGGVLAPSVTSAPSKPESGASRVVLSGGVLGAVLIFIFSLSIEIVISLLF